MNRALVFATREWVCFFFCLFFLVTERYVAALFVLMKHGGADAVNGRDSFGVVASSPARGGKVQTVQVC